MTILLDTNVLSELQRFRPEPRVVTWLQDLAEADVRISVVTIGEIRRGISSMAAGRRKVALEHWVSDDLIPRFSGRILPITLAIAMAWGDLLAEAKASGIGLDVTDAWLAATARTHRLSLATRNVRDFEGFRLELIDPWSA